MKNGQQKIILCINFLSLRLYSVLSFSLQYISVIEYCISFIFSSTLLCSNKTAPICPTCSAIHRERASECPYVKLQDGASDEPLKSTGCLGAKAWRPVEQLPIERFMQLALDIRAYNQVLHCYSIAYEYQIVLYVRVLYSYFV